MEAAALVMFLGALVGSLHATPLPSESLLPTQENFNLDRFMGKWHGVCKQSSDEYKLTQTPGRFQYYFSPCDDLYVVDTDCDEYALVVEHKHKRNSEKKNLIRVTLWPYSSTTRGPDGDLQTCGDRARHDRGQYWHQEEQRDRSPGMLSSKGLFMKKDKNGLESEVLSHYDKSLTVNVMSHNDSHESLTVKVVIVMKVLLSSPGECSPGDVVNPDTPVA